LRPRVLEKGGKVQGFKGIDAPFMVCDSVCDVDADAGDFESGDCSQSYDMLS
jgi:hypothetical protein